MLRTVNAPLEAGYVFRADQMMMTSRHRNLEDKSYDYLGRQYTSAAHSNYLISTPVGVAVSTQVGEVKANIIYRIEKHVQLWDANGYAWQSSQARILTVLR